MIKSFLIFLFTCLLVISCNTKTTESALPIKDSNINSEDTSTSVSEIHHAETILSQPYPEEINGIWGNTSYLVNLIKYNSVGQTMEYSKFDIDLKINQEMILAMRPQYMEPSFFDTIKYELLKAGKDSLYVRSKNSGQKQLFLKIMDLPSSDLWSIFEDEHSAISHMEWDWFHGKYTFTDSHNDKREVIFNKDGSIEGMLFKKYSFGIDVDGKDFLYLNNDSNDSFLLIEYQPKRTYNCYEVEEFEDWEYPLIKKAPAFKLQKIE